MGGSTKCDPAHEDTKCLLSARHKPEPAAIRPVVAALAQATKLVLACMPRELEAVVLAVGVELKVPEHWHNLRTVRAQVALALCRCQYQHQRGMEATREGVRSINAIVRSCANNRSTRISYGLERIDKAVDTLCFVVRRVASTAHRISIVLIVTTRPEMVPPRQLESNFHKIVRGGPSRNHLARTEMQHATLPAGGHHLRAVALVSSTVRALVEKPHMLAGPA
jgi:hypothetical protein